MKIFFKVSLFFYLLAFTSVEVCAQDQALFSVDYQKVCLGTAIQITDLSTGGSGNVSYYYGDGTVSTPPNSNPTHTYTTVSTFNLKQILPIAGTVIDPQTGQPVGYMSYTMAIKVVPTSKLSATYTLLDNTTIDLFIYDNRFDSYDVDFGDGSGITNVSRATSDTTTLNHIFPASIGYPVSIKGKFNTGNGCSSSDLSFSVTPLIKATGNYNPLSNSSHSNALFLTDDNSVLALHVDSTKAENTGLVHYFLKTFDVQQATSQCLPYAPIWSGPKMQASGSSYYFFNKEEDPIRLSPTKDVNIPWTFYNYANGDYVEATITLKEQVTFLGLTDSVKTISLQRKNASDVNMSDPLNALTLKISKNYGFLEVISFLDFPSTVNTSYDLIGLSDPKVGQQLLASRSIYNFDIGDEFHYHKSYSNVPFYADDTKIIRKVIAKYISVNTDTLIYTFQDSRENTHYTYQPPTGTTVGPTTYQVSTYTEKHIVNDSIIYPSIYLSEENEYRTPMAYSFSIPANHGGKMMMAVDYLYDVYYSEPSHCWEQIVDGPIHYTSYIEGCGISYFNGDVLPSSNDSTLVYYKKGSDVYGQPLILSTFSKSTTQALMLYPNPLKQGEELSFSTVHFNATKFSLYNSAGNKVFESIVDSSDLQSVLLPKLLPGLYVVQLLNDKNEYITSKLIIN